MPREGYATRFFLASIHNFWLYLPPAAAGPCCSCEERRPATTTLVSRAVTRWAFSLSTFADLAEDLLDRRLRELRSLLGGHRDPEGAPLDDVDLAGERLDLDLSFLDRDPQRHPR